MCATFPTMLRIEKLEVELAQELYKFSAHIARVNQEKYTYLNINFIKFHLTVRKVLMHIQGQNKHQVYLRDRFSETQPSAIAETQLHSLQHVSFLRSVTLEKSFRTKYGRISAKRLSVLHHGDVVHLNLGTFRNEFSMDCLPIQRKKKNQMCFRSCDKVCGRTYWCHRQTAPSLRIRK